MKEIILEPFTDKHIEKELKIMEKFIKDKKNQMRLIINIFINKNNIG